MELDMNVTERLHAVISILQGQILAQHTTLNVEKMFGHNFMLAPSLEACERLLMGVLLDLEVSDHAKSA